MAEATTGNDLTGVTQSTGIISRISTSISNVRRMTADPAVQKSIPLLFGVIVAFAGLVVFFVNLIYAFAKKKAAQQNPWGDGATTLEWTVPSPPNFHTFEELPKFVDDQETGKSHS